MGLKQPSPDNSSGFIIGGAICLGMALPLTFLSDTLLGFLWSSSGDNRSDFDMLLGALSAAIGVLLLVRGIAGPPGDPDSPEGLARNRQVAFILFGIPAFIAAVVGGICWLVPLYFSHHEILNLNVVNYPKGYPVLPAGVSVKFTLGGQYRSTWGSQFDADSSASCKLDVGRNCTAEVHMAYSRFALGVWSGEWSSIDAWLWFSDPAAPTFKLLLKRCDECGTEPITVSVKSAQPCGPLPHCLEIERNLGRSDNEPCKPVPNCFVQEARFEKHADVVPVTFDFEGFPPPTPP